MTATLTAPFFLIDVAALFPKIFVLGESLLGGEDVLGESLLGGSDVLAGSPSLFEVGISFLGGPDVLGDIQHEVDIIETDALASVTVAKDFFPPLPRVMVMNVGITASPSTGLNRAISGEIFAFVAGSQVQFNMVTLRGFAFSLNAVYSGATNVFVG